MPKRIFAFVFSAIVLVCGSSESPYADIQMFSQDSVCEETIDLTDYSILPYVKEKEIVVPALNQNFIPQGIAFWSAQNWLIISGYFKPVCNGVKSALLAVNATSGQFEGIYTLVDQYGERIEGHFSGVAITDRDLYLSHGTSLLQVPLNSIKMGGATDSLPVIQSHETGIDIGSCNYSDGILWICEHYNSKKNPQIEAAGSGLMIGYCVSDSGLLTPYCIYRVPEKVQGITITKDGQLVFSISYGRANPSVILVYKDLRLNTPDGYGMVGDVEVPVWNIGENCAELILSAPPMSEGCCAVGESVYLIYESAANYYRVLQPYNRSVDPTDRVWRINFNGK